MADRADELIQQLTRNNPPLSPKGDVEKILAAKFADCCREVTDGSHTWVVEHECLKHSQELGFSVNYIGGNLSIPITKGRYVRAIYVKRLLMAIKVKEKYERNQLERSEP